MFKPWIGSLYTQQNPKILILGESHYGNAHVKYNYALEEKTILTIQEQMTEAWKSRFHTKIVSTMIGHRPTRAEKRAFWEAMAYHNLIVEPLPAARIPPPPELWARSVATLPTVLNDLKPDYCFCLGYRMWNVLKTSLVHTPITTLGNIGPAGAFRAEGFHCVFYGMKHPSGRGYRPIEWHRWIGNFRQASGLFRSGRIEPS